MMKLKDLDAIGLTKPRAEIIARAAELVPPTISGFGVPTDTLGALVKHGFAEWVLEADPITQRELGRLVAEYITTARQVLADQPQDWKRALSLLRGAEEHDRLASRKVLRLTDRGLEFAKAWRTRE